MGRSDRDASDPASGKALEEGRCMEWAVFRGIGQRGE